MIGFEGILGHKEQIDFIKKALVTGKLSHSYIFEGVSGIGKKAIAKALAKSVLGNESSFDSGNHPDFMMIVPDGKSIKNEQVEHFQEFVNIKPYLGDYKVIIIDEASTMTVSAQNRILKTLEEAPKNVVIIFICETISALLPTIVSRCQRLSFSRLDQQIIKSYLMSSYGLLEEEALVYSQYADGSLKKALDAVTSESFKEARSLSSKLILSIHKKERAKTITFTDDLLKLDIPFVDVLDIIETYYRDLMMVSVLGMPDRIMNKDYTQELMVCSQLVQRRKLIEYIEAIESAKKMLKENVNESIAFDGLVVALQEG
jgi:DNA polymerase-3 subunit delta'